MVDTNEACKLFQRWILLVGLGSLVWAQLKIVCLITILGLENNNCFPTLKSLPVAARLPVISQSKLLIARLRPNFTGYKRPSLPFSLHFASIRSFLAWTCLSAAPCENLTDRTLAFLSYCVVVYINRIGIPSITFIFLITSVHITWFAPCKNGEADEGDKGMEAMVYMATRWTYSEMCVLWKHNAV